MSKMFQLFNILLKVNSFKSFNCFQVIECKQIKCLYFEFTIDTVFYFQFQNMSINDFLMKAQSFVEISLIYSLF
jgi:hypothetical protein